MSNVGTDPHADRLIAQASEAAAVLNDYPMVCPWAALQLRSLDNSKLAALLTALGESDDATKLAGEGCLAAFEKEGPWVFVLPCSLRDALAHLPESSYPAVAGRWAQHEELALDGWSADDVAPGLAMLKEHAVKAAIANKGLLLWMSL